MNEQVFISHSSNDETWAGMIARTLEKNGIRCWYDVHSIRPGDDYDEEIFQAIKRCPVFLLVLTEHAVEATFVIKELGLAVREHKTIIPVKIGEFDLGKFWLKLENVQIYELGRSWNAQKMEVLTREIQTKLDLVPLDMEKSRPPVKKARDKSGWIRWVAVACMVAVIGGISYAAISMFAGRRETQSSFLEEDPSQEEWGPSQEAFRESPGTDAESSDKLLSGKQRISSGNKAEKLYDMNLMEFANASKEEVLMNTAGQTYEKVVLLQSWNADNYVTYYLGGEYSRFTGIVSCPDQNVSSGGTFTFQVCVDGEEPVKELEIGRSTAPVPLEIDVSGCQFITFRTLGTQAVTDAGVMLSEGVFTP